MTENFEVRPRFKTISIHNENDFNELVNEALLQGYQFICGGMEIDDDQDYVFWAFMLRVI